MLVTWSDSDDESERETTNRVMDFNGKHVPECESSDDNVYDKELASTYKLIYTKWEEACTTVKH